MTLDHLSPFSWGSGPTWSTSAVVLWLVNWFFFWGMLVWLTKAMLPKKILSGSFIFAFLVGAMVLNRKGLQHEPIFQILSSLTKTLQHPLYNTLASSFFPLLIGNIILGVALKFGWGATDPIKSGLAKKVRWPERVNHQKHEFKAARRKAIYLGYEVSNKEPVFLKPEERNKHIQIVGSTGSGKTRFTLFPLMRQDINAGRGVIFIDAKGSSENAKVVFKMVQDAGRAEDFLYFSLTDYEHSSTYNPLKHGNPSQLKDKITASIDWSEPFYQRVCENTLQTLFMDVERAGKRLTLADLLRELQNPPTGYDSFFALAEKHRAHIQTLESEIGLWVESPFGDLLREEDGGIDLMDVYRNKKIAYFALDTQSFQHTAARIGKMITQDLNTLSGLVESGFREDEKKPLAVFIDEFQAFGTRGFINALARGRSSGFWITIAHQSLGDLKAVDDAFLQQVFENTNTKVFLKVNDPETAQMFSDSVGTTKAVETTSQVLLQGDDPKNIMGSKKIVYEYVIHPSELKNLTTGQAVFKSGGGFGRLSLPGVFFATDAVQLPQKRPAKIYAVPKLVSAQKTEPEASPSDEELIFNQKGGV